MDLVLEISAKVFFMKELMAFSVSVLECVLGNEQVSMLLSSDHDFKFISEANNV
jgi:hypothetical protein